MDKEVVAYLYAMGYDSSIKIMRFCNFQKYRWTWRVLCFVKQVRERQTHYHLHVQFSSVQYSVVSDSLRSHESQHARPPCPSPTPEVHSDSRPSSQWCHPTISSFVVPFSSCPQSLPASESFPIADKLEGYNLKPSQFSIWRQPITFSEKAMAPHSSTLAWKIPWAEEPGGLQSMGSLRVGHDWVTSLSRIGEGNGNPLQCSCLENPRDEGAWWAAIYGVAQSRTRLKWLSSSSSNNFLAHFKDFHNFLWLCLLNWVIYQEVG